MNYLVTKDPSGLGSWVLILGCPKLQLHELRDEEWHVSGPSFACCANCPHQSGSAFESHDLNADWSMHICPERLECGLGNAAS